MWSDLSRSVPVGKPVYFTGHSKGGALANLAAARWASENAGKTPPIVTTFAAAKPGDAHFQAAYDKLVPHSLRYEYQDDIVPHLPPGVEFRAMFAKVPLFNDFIANSNAKLPEGAVGFVGVGDLKFIDWSGAIVDELLAVALSALRASHWPRRRTEFWTDHRRPFARRRRRLRDGDPADGVSAVFAATRAPSRRRVFGRFPEGKSGTALAVALSAARPVARSARAANAAGGNRRRRAAHARSGGGRDRRSVHHLARLGVGHLDLLADLEPGQADALGDVVVAPLSSVTMLLAASRVLIVPVASAA